MIIGVTGYKGSGKSTVADWLCSAKKFHRVPFAKPLKDMLRVLGLEDVHLEGSLKEKPTDLLAGKTPREAMQTLGTEWGRGLIHPDLWTTAWKRAVNAVPIGADVVTEDLRFPNEAALIHQRKGLILRIIRPGLNTADDVHPSEHSVAAIRNDITLFNGGTVAELCAEVQKALWP